MWTASSLLRGWAWIPDDEEGAASTTTLTTLRARCFHWLTAVALLYGAQLMQLLSYHVLEVLHIRQKVRRSSCLSMRRRPAATLPACACVAPSPLQRKTRVSCVDVACGVGLFAAGAMGALRVPSPRGAVAVVTLGVHTCHCPSTSAAARAPPRCGDLDARVLDSVLCAR